VLLDLKLGNDDGLDVLAKLLKAQPSLVGGDVHGLREYRHGGGGDAARRVRLSAEAVYAGPDPRGVGENRKDARARKHRVRALENQLAAESPPIDLASAEPATQRAIEIAFKAAATPANILILGPSGTGKSVLAREIHQRSAQREAAFVTVSCPSLSRELLESELFGHVKGSFTGAVADTLGKVAAADGGTLFLDEIGEMPLEIQPKLLRLLQEREYERVGEAKPRRANVRVIAATNRALADEVKAGRFREDLFYRLNVIGVTLPGLRDRPADLARFAESYWRFFAARLGKKITGPWPRP
jgi:NtrC-family two-component system response regulator AlgB